MYENGNAPVVKHIKKTVQTSIECKMFTLEVLSYDVENIFLLPLHLFSWQKMHEIMKLFL